MFKALYMEWSDKIYTDKFFIKLELTLICIGGALAFSNCGTDLLVIACVVRLLANCKELKDFTKD
jgi:hypothetical protein